LNEYAYSEPGGFGMFTNRFTLQTGLFGIPQGTRTILVFGDHCVTVKMMLFGATSWYGPACIVCTPLVVNPVWSYWPFDMNVIVIVPVETVVRHWPIRLD